MGGVGFTEMLLLAVIALIVIGPQKLPKIARSAGRLTRQARNAWQGLQSQLQAELDDEHNRKIMESTRGLMEKATGLREDGTPAKGGDGEAESKEGDAADKPVGRNNERDRES